MDSVLWKNTERWSASGMRWPAPVVAKGTTAITRQERLESNLEEWRDFEARIEIILWRMKNIVTKDRFPEMQASPTTLGRLLVP